MSLDYTRLRWNGWGLVDYREPATDRAEVWHWLAQQLGLGSLPHTPPQALDETRLPPSRLDDDLRRALCSIVNEDAVRSDAFTRAYHARGRSYYDLLQLRSGAVESAPDAVVLPQSGPEVQALLQLAEERGIAIVPFGGGSSVVGGVTAASGGFQQVLTLDLTRMARLIATDQVSLTATAEAGISGPALEQALNAQGLTLGHFPQSFEFSTLGGWIAHAGAGQQSNGNGRSSDWLKAVRLATPRGVLEEHGFPGSAAGPRLTSLALGSEGVFGIVTEATMRVHRQTTQQRFAAWLCPDFAAGAALIRAAVQDGIEVSMLRLSDAAETSFYRAFGSIGKAPGVFGHLATRYLTLRGLGTGMCALIALFEGDDSLHQSTRLRRLASRHGAVFVGAGPGKSWARGRFHGPYLRDPLLDRGVGVDTLETAADWSRLEGLYVGMRRALERGIEGTAPHGARGIVMCHISHSYSDGASLYFTMIFPRDPKDPIAQWRRIKQAANDAIVANGGTISHHHGVGEDHRAWLQAEKGTLGIGVLRAVKGALDPAGVLNPGKLIPE